MARHFITSRNTVRPGIIRTECTCGATFEGAPAETDTAVNAHIDTPAAEWGVSDDTSVIDTFPTEAQARIEAYACRDIGDRGATAVHLVDGRWVDDDGTVHDKPTGRPLDMLATPGKAAHALAFASAMADRDRAETRWLDALTAEARRYGYDPAVLDAIHAETVR